MQTNWPARFKVSEQSSPHNRYIYLPVYRFDLRFRGKASRIFLPGTCLPHGLTGIRFTRYFFQTHFTPTQLLLPTLAEPEERIPAARPLPKGVPFKETAGLSIESLVVQVKNLFLCYPKYRPTWGDHPSDPGRTGGRPRSVK